MSEQSDDATQQSTIVDVVETAKERARKNEAKAERATGDPEKKAFFKGSAAAHRGIVEDFGDFDDIEELDRATCPSCDGEGCDTCAGYGYVRVEADS